MGLRAILLGALLLRLFLLAAIPPGEAPDERAHAEYVRYLAEERRLPVQTERTGEGDRYEYYQPPLFYLLAAPLHAVAGGGALALYAARLLNAAFSLLTVAALAAFARAIAPDSRDLPLAAAAFAGFLPAFAANGATAGNDALLVLLSTLALLRLAGAVRKEALGSRDMVSLALLLGLALLTKISGAVLLPVVALALLLARPGRRSLRESALVIGGAILLAAPWYLRNLTVYARLVPLGVANVAWTDRPSAVEAALWIAGNAGRSFWVALGRHNEVDVPAMRSVLLAAGFVLLLAFGAWVGRSERSRDRGVRAITLACGFGFVFLVGLVAFFGWWFRQAQGRFLFPMIAPVASAAASSAARAVGPERARALPAWIAGGLLLLLGLELLFAFLPKYYPSVAPWAR